MFFKLDSDFNFIWNNKKGRLTQIFGGEMISLRYFQGNIQILGQYMCKGSLFLTELFKMGIVGNNLDIQEKGNKLFHILQYYEATKIFLNK